MIRKHLEKTQQYENRGQERPAIHTKGLKLSIQHGGMWFSSSENGAPATVQIKGSSSSLDAGFAMRFEKYHKPSLGYLNVPVSELENYLQDEQTQEDENSSGTSSSLEEESSDEKTVYGSESGDIS